MKLDPRALDAHALPPVIDGDKESKGRLLILAGSRDVPGAALLAATAAMRAGAGKLRIATVADAALPLGVAMPEAMVFGLAQAADGGFAPSSANSIAKLAAEVDAVVAGPGAKRNSASKNITAALPESKAVVALDDAFPETTPPPKQQRRPVPVLLPNADEPSALRDSDPAEVDSDPIACGRR